MIDETNVEWTVPQLTGFLQELSMLTGAKTIHLIAHSMGNRALTNALRVFATKQQPGIPQFHHVVLTAPDIDAGVFLQLAGTIKGTAKQITLYTSPKDKALKWSHKFHGYPRAGEQPSFIPGIDTIDASSVDTSFLGHSYFSSNRSVIADLFSLLRDGHPPNARFGMVPVKSGGSVYYAFRP